MVNEEIQKYGEDLQRGLDTPNDNILFQSLLLRGIELFSITDIDFHTRFSISKYSLARWKDGSTAPVPRSETCCL